MKLEVAFDGVLQVHCAAWVSAVRSHFDPGRVAPLNRLPPEALLPGQIPAHDARCPADGNTDMSQSHSASSTCAVRGATPGIVQSRSTKPAIGATIALIF
jgi:hypothetical protein